MIIITSKLIGAFKSSHLPLILLTAFDFSKKLRQEQRKLRVEDDAPGDNFPYMAVSREK